MESVSTSPDTKPVSQLCFSFELVDGNAVFLKRSLQAFNTKVFGNILQKLEVKEIPHSDSAAEENDLFEGDVADNASHSLLIKWDVLFLADRHFVEEDAYGTVCYSSMFQCAVSSA